MKPNKNETLVPLTAEICTRLKDLQKDKHYTNLEIAGKLGLTLNQYKNIIRWPNGNKFLKEKVIKQFTQCYECTYEYIIGTSDDPKMDNNNNVIIHPISFPDKDEMITYIIRYLNDADNYQVLCDLYFFLNKLPIDVRNTMLNAMNSIAKMLKVNALISRRDSLDPQTLIFITNILKADNPELTEATIKLAMANESYQNNDFKNALRYYMEIIYNASPQSAVVADKALKKIKCFHKAWPKFPNELKPLICKLDQLQKNKYFSYPEEIKQIINEYLSKTFDKNY